MIPTLETWKNAGKSLVIFSSGSVQAQIQFFSYVQDGADTRDIKPFFSAHFDTVNAGSKLESSSYKKICQEIGVEEVKVTFLTDNVKGTSKPSKYISTGDTSTAVRGPFIPCTRFHYQWRVLNVYVKQLR